MQFYQNVDLFLSSCTPFKNYQNLPIFCSILILLCSQGVACSAVLSDPVVWLAFLGLFGLPDCHTTCGIPFLSRHYTIQGICKNLNISLTKYVRTFCISRRRKNLFIFPFSKIHFCHQEGKVSNHKLKLRLYIRYIRYIQYVKYELYKVYKTNQIPSILFCL